MAVRMGRRVLDIVCFCVKFPVGSSCFLLSKSSTGGDFYVWNLWFDFSCCAGFWLGDEGFVVCVKVRRQGVLCSHFTIEN